MYGSVLPGGEAALKTRAASTYKRYSFYYLPSTSVSLVLHNPGSQPMILIVDDDPAFLESARKLFGPEWQVFFAMDSKQALRLVEDLEFSVVLVDLVLGKENGFELIGEFHNRFPGLPVVAMSGIVKQHVLEAAKAYGAVRVLSKPATPDWKELIAGIGQTHV